MKPQGDTVGKFTIETGIDTELELSGRMGTEWPCVFLELCTGILVSVWVATRSRGFTFAFDERFESEKDGIVECV